MIRLGIMLPAAGIMLLAGACGGGNSATPTPQAHALKGTVTLKSFLSTLSSDQATRRSVDYANGDGPELPDVNWEVAKPCVGSGGFADMQGGAQIVIKNAAGTIVANAHLDAGTGVGTDYLQPYHNAYTATCVFAFTIDSMPDSDFYSVNIGNRPAVTYSRSDMESNNWTLAVSLGP